MHALLNCLNLGLEVQQIGRLDLLGPLPAKDFPEYRTQEFIGAFADALREGKITQIMYVPTEANIPITEATRLNK